ncbi:MAG: DUF1957 domain-containing protein [Planctomycetes bacterium]|nr:DUF1957 domain-containing protein [Planctomycetota bacterium]MBI3847419.1 DUF1957 domain-containing protein [Planctomycetota bacterium]
MSGSLCLILHAHLPFVRHPEHATFFEETWLFEAITETYLPLLESFERLDRDGIRYRIALSVSPTLLAMLDDDLLKQRYEFHLEGRIRFASTECDRTRLLPTYRALARRALESLEHARSLWREQFAGDLVRALRDLGARGNVELFTTAATHGYLPLMLGRRSSWRAQVRVGVDEFRRHFGSRPAGFWLPECAYQPGVDEVLAECGVRWFVVDAHGLLFATPRPRSGPYAPIVTPAGVAAFGRDPESSRQVWSAVDGYPGDPAYRDFHEDVGYALPWDYVGPHLHVQGSLDRAPTGIKYHRVTGGRGRKEPYDPKRADEKTAEHAAHFVESRRVQAAWLAERLGHEPVIVAPYDAELFGHWWHEGPAWLEQVIRLAAPPKQNDVRRLGSDPVSRMRTPTDVLDEGTHLQRAVPAASSWGEGGYHALWADESNHWIHPRLHEAAQHMEGLARRHPRAPGRSWLRRALDQAARELLLAQASDWAFILHVRTVPAYAASRVRDHLDAFFEIAEAIRRGRLDDPDVRECIAVRESRTPLFPAPTFDYRVFQPDRTVRSPTVRARTGASPITVKAKTGRIL